MLWTSESEGPSLTPISNYAQYKWLKATLVARHLLGGIYLWNDDKCLLVCVVGVNVFDGGGHQLWRELGRQPNRQRHPALQGRVGARSVRVIVVVITNLKIKPKLIVIMWQGQLYYSGQKSAFQRKKSWGHSFNKPHLRPNLKKTDPPHDKRYGHYPSIDTP